MSAKLPILKVGTPAADIVIPGVKQFIWTDAQEKCKIGEGSFGDVYSAKFKGRLVVLKKLKCQKKQRDKLLFTKEVRILSELQCKHIVKVEGFCSSPIAVMLEYACFDFQPLGINGDRVTCLMEYLDFVCSGNFVEQLSFLQPKIAQDIITAIAYLHKRNIAHRDIKAANILVSNTHYSQLTDPDEMEKAWSKENIICKLADFGESRSIMNQTATLNHTRTKNLERGTLVYNAPEALLISDQTISFSLEELKQSDIWSLGMVLFLLVNPDVEYPYSQEIEECGFESFSEVKDELRKLMEQKKKPRHSVEYDSLRLTQWSKISKAFEACSSFIPSERVSAEEALTIVCPDCESSGEALAVIPAPECLIDVNKDPSSSKHGSTISAPECLIDVNKDLKEMESIDVAENRDGITEDVHSSSNSEDTGTYDSFKPRGDAYKDDAMTPVFSWRKTAYLAEEMVSLLLGEYNAEDLCISQPVNVSHNVSFLLDINYFKHPDDLKCDDMGSWKHNGSPKRWYSVKQNARGIKTIHCVEKKPEKTNDDIFQLKRTYYKNNSDETVRKIVAKLEDSCGNVKPYVLVQYLFKGEEHEVERILPHGNAKVKSSYRRLQTSTRETLKRSILEKEKTAKEILDVVYLESGDVTHARSASELPRGPKDLYNARHLAKQSCSFTGKRAEKCLSGGQTRACTSNVSMDNIWTLLERARREEEECKDSTFIRECAIHPDLFVVLANDKQLDEVSKFCTNQNEFSVFGADPTFNIFDRNISLTVTTFRNLKLVNPNTEKPPVFVGPLMLHQRKDWKTYSKFSHALTVAKPELEGILSCGTDGEKALIDGFKRNFTFAIFLRCFLHVKDNISRELASRGISPGVKKQFIDEIFGKQVESTKFYGLVDCDSEDEFDEKLESLKTKWNEREGNRESSTLTFHEWFKKEKAEDIKASMLKHVRIEAGLGNPPSEYTNNDPEAANFMIKHGLHFSEQKPHEFIQKIKDIVETQQRNEDRAVFGKGPYRLRKEFAHLGVNDREQSHLTHVQKKRKLVSYHNAGMNDKKDVTSENFPNPTEQSTSSSPFQIVAQSAGFIDVPQPILDAIITKATNLLSTPGNVIPTPGASDGSYIVAGTVNKIHNVKPGKGGSWTCDRACVNKSTKVCEHVLAVAQVSGRLNEFVAWLRRTRKRASLMGMIEQGGPKSAGKKPSKRKRTNAKAMPVRQHVDLLDQDDEYQTTGSDAQSFPSMAVTTPFFRDTLPPDAGSSLLAASNSFTSSFTHLQPAASPQTHPSTTLIEHHQPRLLSPQTMSFSTPLSPEACTVFNSKFNLKWVAGTTVSKCYGCGKGIVNPPQVLPDDLIIVYRDIRQYRDRVTGQLHVSASPQNVHFHLRRHCILIRYPQFRSELLVVSPEFMRLLRPEHLQRLFSEFGWTLN